MKIILSQSGGGKSKELVSIATKHSSEGKLVRLITNEIPLSKFKEDIAEKEGKFNVLLISYEANKNLNNIVASLILNKSSEVIIVDCHPQINERMDEFLKVIDYLFKDSSQEIYVTVQVPFESTLLNGEKLTILDYNDYIKNRN